MSSAAAPSIFRPVTYKKHSGSLLSTGQGLYFQDDDDDSGDYLISVDWADLAKIDKNKENATKARLKFTTTDASSFVISFKNRDKLEKAYLDLSERWSAVKGDGQDEELQEPTMSSSDSFSAPVSPKMTTKPKVGPVTPNPPSKQKKGSTPISPSKMRASLSSSTSPTKSTTTEPTTIATSHNATRASLKPPPASIPGKSPSSASKKQKRKVSTNVASNSIGQPPVKSSSPTKAKKAAAAAAYDSCEEFVTGQSQQQRQEQQHSSEPSISTTTFIASTRNSFTGNDDSEDEYEMPPGAFADPTPAPNRQERHSLVSNSNPSTEHRQVEDDTNEGQGDGPILVEATLVLEPHQDSDTENEQVPKKKASKPGKHGKNESPQKKETTRDEATSKSKKSGSAKKTTKTMHYDNEEENMMREFLEFKKSKELQGSNEATSVPVVKPVLFQPASYETQYRSPTPDIEKGFPITHTTDGKMIVSDGKSTFIINNNNNMQQQQSQQQQQQQQQRGCCGRPCQAVCCCIVIWIIVGAIISSATGDDED